MDYRVEQQIRALAQPLWESAARPYGMALDFWLMAEQMVLEMMAATARLQETALAEQRPLFELPAAVPVEQVRQLAQSMWESAGRQYGMAQEFWLAAERHILSLTRAAAAQSGAGKAAEVWIDELVRLSPSAYVERIQLAAYYLWEATGQQYGRAMDFWLEAEKQTLAALAELSSGPQRTSPVIAAAKARIAQLDREEAARVASRQAERSEPGAEAAAAPAAEAVVESPAAPQAATASAAAPSRRRLKSANG